MKRWWLTLALAIATGPAMAADAPPLTLDRVFASPDLSGPQPQALKLSPDGTLVTLVRNREDERERFDLWALDPTTGEQRMLIDSKALSAGGELSEAEKMRRERDRTLTGKRGILQYDWSPDGRALLTPVDGELMIATRDGVARRLGVNDALDPAISPRGTYVSFVRGQNLHVQSLAGGDARRVTPDGGGTVHWGEAEFVAQEEMDRRNGSWWSPDERFLAVERFDEAQVHIATRAAIGATGTRLYEQRYPAAGTPNVRVELHVMRPDGTGAVKVDLGPDPDIYLARVNWSPDGAALYVQRENRAQTALDLLRVDPVTGRSELVFTERAAPKSWINLSSVFRVLADGAILWWSERDGHGHLYLFRDGGWTQLTRGDWEVAGVIGVDEAKGRVFLTGNRDGVLERHVYAVDLRGGEPIRLTERGWWNTATMDGGAIRMIVTRSNRDQPPQTYLADADGRRLAWISENAVTAAHPYAPYLAAHRPTTYGTTRAEDGTLLHWRMVTPPLVRGRCYPVFFQHYGGPHSQTVDVQWTGQPLEQAIAQRGWIVFELDNRGSANRGKAFENAIARAMGSVEVADQRAGARYLATLPYVDPKRIVTYGWSYGGYMTVKMLEADPGLYAAGIAGAPVTDWSLYDTHYTERYMGDPRTDAAAYATGEALADASRIRDPLLLIHGMADDNVFLENTTALAAKLQAEGVRFEMMLYPGKTHGAVRDLHPWLTMFDFLDRRVVTDAERLSLTGAASTPASGHGRHRGKSPG